MRVSLARLDPGVRWSVINRGIPGMNSAQVAAALEGWLRHDRPDFVVVWTGANNWWNREDPAGLHAARDRSSWRSLLDASRAYRLYLTYTAQAALGDWDAEEAQTRARANRWLFGAPVGRKERFVKTVRDLSRIGDILEQQGVAWLLVTYPQPDFRWQRSAVEQVARRGHVAIVHTADDLERARREHREALPICPWPVPEGQTCMMVDAMGSHPTGLLYGYVAESIAKALVATPPR